MKKILIIAAFMACATNAKAADVVQIIGSSITLNVVSVSSSVPTQIDNSGNNMAARTSIEVQNIDASSSVVCGFTSGVTTTTGRIIAAGASWVLPMRAAGPNGALPVYCITTKTTAATNVAVIQSY